MSYNATAYAYEGDRLVSTEAVELDPEGRVIRGCGHWSAHNGTPEYEAIWRSGKIGFLGIDRIEVVKDGAAGYRNAISGLALPPTYTVGK